MFRKGKKLSKVLNENNTLWEKVVSTQPDCKAIMTMCAVNAKSLGAMGEALYAKENKTELDETVLAMINKQYEAWCKLFKKLDG